MCCVFVQHFCFFCRNDFFFLSFVSAAYYKVEVFKKKQKKNWNRRKIYDKNDTKILYNKELYIKLERPHQIMKGYMIHIVFLLGMSHPDSRECYATCLDFLHFRNKMENLLERSMALR